jgi:outer membrane lipoprotein SlyB
MDDSVATEVGVFDDETAAEGAVRRLEAAAVPPEQIGIVNDPRKAREVVGTRARQLVVPLALAGAIVGIVVLLLLPGQDAYRSGGLSGLVLYAIVGALAGIVAGALIGKVLPARDPDRYEGRVERGDILVTVKVAPPERERVRRILAASGALNLAEERTTEAP